MAYKLNPFTKKLDFYGVVPTGSSDPSSASPGDLFINTSDNGMKVYYGGNWQTLHTLTPSSGIGIGYWVIGTNFVVS
jgi:energy-converting hydrogenase Eha subunit G